MHELFWNDIPMSVGPPAITAFHWVDGYRKGSNHQRAIKWENSASGIITGFTKLYNKPFSS